MFISITINICHFGYLFKPVQGFIFKEFSWFNSSFTLDVPGPNDYSITGSFWEHEYEFQRHGEIVARVSKRYFSWTDTYGIEVVDGEDVLAILATCIVIDLICHDEKND